jgi:Uma2 family endonuclease
MAHGKLVLTYQAYLRMPDDGMRRELLGGDLHVTPAPGPSHQRVVLRLAVLLDAWVRRHALGEVFPAPVDVVLSEADVVQPDLVYVSAGRLDIVTARAIQGAPDLVVEVLSPSTAPLDRGPKLATYARAGVREYWLVDPDMRAAEQHVPEGGAFRPAARAAGDGTFTSPLLSGLSITPADIWR